VTSATEHGEQRSAEERAEELVGRLAEDVTRVAQRLFWRAREEAEDILAEAREIHDRSRPSSPER
jgi:cell division septum initiation protein DivIVA